MEIHRITSDYAVSPQIAPEDMAALARQGFTTVICNRPDHEVGPELQHDRMRDAAKAAGLDFVYNPVENGGMTLDAVTGQGAALEKAPGDVFAYCRSGTRCAVVWALSQAGQTPTDQILEATRAAGYDLAGLRAQIEAMAGRH